MSMPNGVLNFPHTLHSILAPPKFVPKFSTPDIFVPYSFHPSNLIFVAPPPFFLHFSSLWVNISLHEKFITLGITAWVYSHIKYNPVSDHCL